MNEEGEGEEAGRASDFFKKRRDFDAESYMESGALSVGFDVPHLIEGPKPYDNGRRDQPKGERGDQALPHGDFIAFGVEIVGAHEAEEHGEKDIDDTAFGLGLVRGGGGRGRLGSNLRG